MMQNEIKKRYYKVIAKCGHVGRMNYVPIAFPVVAANGKEAAARARLFPRVKHDDKFAILQCSKINKEEFETLLDITKKDPYLSCKNRQQQREIKDFDKRIMKEESVVRKRKEEKPFSRQFLKYKRYDRYNNSMEAY